MTTMMREQVGGLPEIVAARREVQGAHAELIEAQKRFDGSWGVDGRTHSETAARMRAARERHTALTNAYERLVEGAMGAVSAVFAQSITLSAADFAAASGKTIDAWALDANDSVTVRVDGSAISAAHGIDLTLGWSAGDRSALRASVEASS